jgi:hypothetical protein
MNTYWRAANYLSVGQIYLYDNPLLKRPLALSDVKPLVVGHWGTTPGQNFIYVHLNRVITTYDLDMFYVAGPGHGGPALVANTYLRGLVLGDLSRRELGRVRDEEAVHPILVPRRIDPRRGSGRRVGEARRGAVLPRQPGLRHHLPALPSLSPWRGDGNHESMIAPKPTVAVSGHRAEVTDPELESIAWMFLGSEFAGRVYRHWPIDRRVDAYVAHHGLRTVFHDQDACDALLERVMANIGRALRNGVLTSDHPDVACDEQRTPDHSPDPRRNPRSPNARAVTDHRAAEIPAVSIRP